MTSTTNDDTPISAQVKKYLPWIVAVALFMENLDATIVNTAVPVMSASLKVVPLSLKSVLTSYTLSLAVFIPVSGWMADRFGSRHVFRWALIIFTLGSLLCGFAVNVPMLVTSRILQGMGGAMMTPVGRLALVRAFPRSEILAAMNFVVIPALIGPLIGPFVGGLIVHWLHWRVIFFLNIPFGLVGLWLMHRHMPDFREPTGPLDWRGFLLFGTGIAMLSYVLEVFGEHSMSNESMLFMLAGALVLLSSYAWHSRNISEPVMALWLFRVRTFRVSTIGGFVTRLGISGMPFLLPLLYQIGLGYQPWAAGLLTMPQAVASIFMKMTCQKILARFGHRRVLIVNTVLLGLTICLFTTITAATPVWIILLLSFTQGFFSSLQFSSMNTLAYADVDNRDASKASSIASTVQQMSLCFGVAFASLLAALFIGNLTQTNPGVAIPAIHKAFLAMGLITIVASATFWELRPHDGDVVSNRT